jgi:hypothetical protein
MRRLLCWLGLCIFAASATGCFLDDIRRDNTGISRTGVSAKARQIESDLDWSSL